MLEQECSRMFRNAWNRLARQAVPLPQGAVTGHSWNPRPGYGILVMVMVMESDYRILITRAETCLRMVNHTVQGRGDTGHNSNIPQRICALPQG